MRWSYENTDWGSIDASFAACSLGKEQSPIDLRDGKEVSLPSVVFRYRHSDVSIENKGHTLQVNVPQENHVILAGTKYYLQQFHFHHGSEHTLNGARLPMEMHLVHESADSKLLVIGVFFREGAASEALAPVWGNLLVKDKPVCVENIDLMSLVPEMQASWRYRGSLTTPPCSEGVSWIIFETTLSLSKSQINKFSEVYGTNYRPLQPLGKRMLYREKHNLA